MNVPRTVAMISTSEMRAPRREARLVRIQMRHEEIEPGIGSIHLKGRLDVLGVQKIELQFTELTTNLRKPIIVDLSGVELMSSVGLGLLITVATMLKAEGRTLILLKPQPRVERVIRIAGLGEFLPIELEQHGLIAKKIYAELPPKVEYALTELGNSVLPVVNALGKWGDDHQKELRRVIGNTVPK